MFEFGMADYCRADRQRGKSVAGEITTIGIDGLADN